MKTFAERLRAARKAVGISQEQLAAFVGKGLTQQAIAAMENPKKAREGSKYVPAMAVILQVEALWLASGDGPRTRNEKSIIQAQTRQEGAQSKEETVMTITGFIKALIEVHGEAAVQRAIAQVFTTDQEASAARPQLKPRTS
jgi:transcriptional regulator with XRE-family HTH domain